MTSNHSTAALGDECLNQLWFVSHAHAKVVIEAWRRKYNEERPKNIKRDDAGNLSQAIGTNMLYINPGL